MIVLKSQRPAMQPRNGRDQAEPKTAARLGTARFQAHEPAQHPLAVGFGHALALIGHDDLHHVALGIGRHPHFRLQPAIAADVLRRSVFEGIVEEIGDGLAEQLAIGADEHGAVAAALQHKSALFRHRLVELDHVVHELGEVEPLLEIAAGAGLEPGDRQAAR